MQFRATTLALTLALSAAAIPALAQPGDTTTVVKKDGKYLSTHRFKLSAVVTGVDAATRTVSLQGPKGRTQDVVAGPEVKNFEQIKVGDTLLVDFVEALAIEVKKKSDGIREREETEVIAPRTPAQHNTVLSQETMIVANVVAVNKKARTITLQGPTKTRTLKVKDPAALRHVRVGDQVEAKFTEAVALEMLPTARR